MSDQAIEVIDEYEVLYAVRTGVTILVQKMATFDGGIEVPAHFTPSSDNPRDIVITAADRSAILRDMRKEHLDAAIERGVIMFYEMREEEVVRCTPCNFAR
jgi:hypothetical protein